MDEQNTEIQLEEYQKLDLKNKENNKETKFMNQQFSQQYKIFKQINYFKKKELRQNGKTQCQINQDVLKNGILKAFLFTGRPPQEHLVLIMERINPQPSIILYQKFSYVNQEQILEIFLKLSKISSTFLIIEWDVMF
ncbi:unnamed protein product [Paramecium octaurelia]|uniref:Uncharacterized protein n=1 Tax=Paramecium octaurelia TaxID=43137 RepID=A0A8S1XC53_PAROT|nr:unnamed protein product [Paramecium octaurelia]